MGFVVSIVTRENAAKQLVNRPSVDIPFFTTKAEGSGISLELSRQIAEAHGGTLTLANRSAHIGCKTQFGLPLAREINVRLKGFTIEDCKLTI